jgi:hypothetical protein
LYDLVGIISQISRLPRKRRSELAILYSFDVPAQAVGLMQESIGTSTILF